MLTVEDDRVTSSVVSQGASREGGGKTGGVYKRPGSLALRFYGSSSSIMRRKSTIKPLLHRGELPVLNHCVQRALTTGRRLTETLGETAAGEIDSFMIDKRATPKPGFAL